MMATRWVWKQLETQNTTKELWVIPDIYSEQSFTLNAFLSIRSKASLSSSFIILCTECRKWKIASVVCIHSSVKSHRWYHYVFAALLLMLGNYHPHPAYIVDMYGFHELLFSKAFSHCTQNLCKLLSSSPFNAEFILDLLLQFWFICWSDEKVSQDFFPTRRMHLAHLLLYAIFLEQQLKVSCHYVIHFIAFLVLLQCYVTFAEICELSKFRFAVCG